MTKRKMHKYYEVQSFRNVIDVSHFKPNITYDSKGEWSAYHFGNNHPVILELACGKGEYTLGLARLFPEKNIVGIDIKGERIWRGAKTAIEEPLDNVMFIRGYIDHITNFFGQAEVDEIWITFPDPYLKDRKEHKRLTHPEFLNRYKSILKPNGIIHLKTDSPELYEFTQSVISNQNLKLIEQIDDIYSKACIPEILSIQTTYEKKHIANGRTIRYISFQLNNEN